MDRCRSADERCTRKDLGNSCCTFPVDDEGER